MSWIRRVIAIVIGLGVVAAIVFALLPQPVPVELGRIDRGPMQVTVEEDGRTRVRTRYVVSAPVAGRLDRIALRAGDSVEEGALVAWIRPADSAPLDPRSRAEVRGRMNVAMATVQRAKAEAQRALLGKTLALQELDKTRTLVQKGAIPSHDLEVAQVEYDTRAKELEAAELAVRVAAQEAEAARSLLASFQSVAGAPDAALTVKAPSSGRVLRVLQENAGIVAPGTPLLELGDPSSLEIVVDVLTSDAVRIQPGAAVTMSRWGGEQPLRGKVRFVEPSAFTKVSALGVEEQRVNVIVDPDADLRGWQSVGDGFRVDASIVTWDVPSVLRAPASALFRAGDAWAVFIVAGDRAALRSIEVGKRNDTYAELTRGVSEGENVILHPSDKVMEGVRVRVVR